MQLNFLLGIVLLLGINALVHNIAPDIVKTRWFYPIYNWLMLSCCVGYVVGL
jgi:hypothetical protein